MALTALDLIGTWRFSRPEEPSGQAFLHFSYTQAYDYMADGEVRQFMRLWYALEAPDLIRFRNRPEEEGWTCRVALVAGRLIITTENGKTICTRARPDEIPEWFQRQVAG